MSERVIVNFQRKPCYDIVLDKGFDSLLEELELLQYLNQKFVIMKMHVLMKLHQLLKMHI